jgi:signal transduction histidine kinase
VADGEAGSINETQREFLAIAVRNSDRLGALINDLLDMNRIEANGLELKLEPIDIAAVLADVQATFQREAYSKGLVMRQDVVELPLVLGDKARLLQVFCNLVSNAIKYTPHGEIGIKATKLQDAVEVVVYDSGIGMTPEETTKLFTKFFRGSNPVVTESRGTGLGLVIAKAILRAHRATIDVESRPGQGTRFRVVLPLNGRIACQLAG